VIFDAGRGQADRQIRFPKPPIAAFTSDKGERNPLLNLIETRTRN